MMKDRKASEKGRQWEKYMEDEKIREFMEFYLSRSRESIPNTLENLDFGMMQISEKLNGCDLNLAAALAPILRDLAVARAALSSNIPLIIYDASERQNNDVLADQKWASKLDINPDDLQYRQKDYLNLAMLFRTSLDSVKDNYDILVQQCREAGII